MTTKGPWYVQQTADPEFRDIYGSSALGPDGRRWYADTVAWNVRPEDASLVASAPELLEVLQEVADYWAGGDVPEELDAKMRTVLRKARGEP